MKTPAQDAENPDQETLVAPTATAEELAETLKDLDMDFTQEMTRLNGSSAPVFAVPATSTYYATFVAGAPLLHEDWPLIPVRATGEELKTEVAVSLVTAAFHLGPGPCTLPTAP